MANESTVVSFRMPTHEYQALTQAAEAKGVSMAEYIRSALDICVSQGGWPIYPPQNTCAHAPFLYAHFDGTTINTPPADPRVVQIDYWRKL